jgi:hypothetical protein
VAPPPSATITRAPPQPQQLIISRESSLSSGQSGSRQKHYRINSTYEVLARAANLMIARGAYREAARMYPDDKILLYGGARVIEKNK